MSADNGVYVLESPLMAEAPNGQEIHYADEYRVAHCQAIENLWDCGQYSLDFERQMFGQSPVYHDKDEAILAAHRIAETITVLEYGVKVLHMEHPFPVPLRK